jgi:hypothetical protein
MSDIDKMAEQFKDFAALQAYCDGQYRMIVSLSTKINELEAKNKQLEELLGNSTPIIKEKSAEIQLLSQGTDEETICRIQLKILRDKCIAGEELTLEETKRAEIYAKLLLAIRNGDKKAEEELSKGLDDAQLLEFLKETK